MVTSMASDNPSLVIGHEEPDPFVSGFSPVHATSNHRFAGFDNQNFALGPDASPTSAKRALEAHLADTERRMEEAGKLGTSLVKQRQELTDRLKEVEQLQAEDELSPDLKERLTSLEKDFNEVARDSARAFLPKQRVPSNEASTVLPFTPTKDTVRRSMSPSKFESMATGSPSKFSVPNRKMRNQPANRIHDIEFAAEISTSLITQVRNLQSLLQERDEELKDLKSEKSGLQVEVEGFQQRMRNLDESESRYKDENWNLETQIQELIAGQKEAADREKKLANSLNLLQADKNATQRELDEFKAAHSKLAEDHAAAVKHHDIELGTARRNAVMAEGERAALQRKIDELTSQNQELAKAISVERGRTSQRTSPIGSSEDDLENAGGNMTPEHSPPPSPIKPTPRHSMLETETIKTSLQHAQRTIQSLRTNVHREKTEKLELKRLLQDARDEIDKLRSDPVERPHQKRAREAKSREFKKPAKLDKLGTARAVKAEILEDPEWEEVATARGSPPMAPSGHIANVPMPSTETDDFQTANEAVDSTDAFETAHERGTETEDFQTGAEEFSDSDTEIESPSKRAGARKANALKKAPMLAASSREFTYESTASTSGSEDEDFMDPTRTPTSPSLRMRMRASRSNMTRRSRQFSDDLGYQTSPASHPNGSFRSQDMPQQSLFAELGELEGSDEDSAMGTPGQRSLRSVTPASTMRGVTASPRPSIPPLPSMPRIIMVDSGMMTDPVDIQPHDAVPAELSTSAHSVASSGQDRPVSMAYSDAGAQHDPDMQERLAQFPSPRSALAIGDMPVPSLPPPQTLSMSNVFAEEVEPLVEPEPEPSPPPRFGLSNVVSEHVEPVVEPESLPPSLNFSRVVTEDVQPVAEPELEPQVVRVVEYVEAPKQPPAELGFSALVSEAIEPRDDPEIPWPTLSISSIASEHVEPIAERQSSRPVFSLSVVVSEQVEPKEEPAVLPPPLTISTILSEQVEPINSSQDIPTPALLGFSAVQALETEPTEPESPIFGKPALQQLGFSAIESLETSPRSPKRNAFIIPLDEDVRPSTPVTRDFFGSSSMRKDVAPGAVIIAEDETRQSPSGSPLSETPESQRPFKEISANANTKPTRSITVQTSDTGAQTALTAETIDQLLYAKNKHLRQLSPRRSDSIASVSSMGTPATVRVHRSQESLNNILRSKSKMADNGLESPLENLMRRPGSASSTRASVKDAPPLPPNHREAIEAARTGTANSGHGSMGPPLFPASAYKNRPRTPASLLSVNTNTRGDPTPRPERLDSHHGTADIHSSTRIGARSRKSSVSSFASEVDQRFNIHAGMMGMEAHGFGPNTDPRMIQAITQTMIGEYLWKYTRKTGRGEMSENRHRRYFWVHPYTRTLYWSDRDPTNAGRSELRAKSVPIEAVRVVTDDNIMPPGLHRKSLIVISPGRSVKFTCTTGQRHETWFNALSYLLLRTNGEGEADTEEMVNGLTREDVDEFNPSYARRHTAGAITPRPAPSISSYNSRATRQDSSVNLEVPTLTPAHKKNNSSVSVARPSLAGRLSGYWKSTTDTLSLRSRSGARDQYSLYSNNEVHDSAEDLRAEYERQDRESDRLDNVRACCDGKHDVGTLTQKRGSSGGQLNGHSHPSRAGTPAPTVRSGA